MPVMERRSIVFSGRVQGVGFRITAQDVARGFEVTGWVRNEDDGSVRMEIQGAPSQIDACVAALERRMSAFIRSRTSCVAPTEPEESGFEIRH